MFPHVNRIVGGLFEGKGGAGQFGEEIMQKFGQSFLFDAQFTFYSEMETMQPMQGNQMTFSKFEILQSFFLLLTKSVGESEQHSLALGKLFQMRMLIAHCDRKSQCTTVTSLVWDKTFADLLKSVCLTASFLIGASLPFIRITSGDEYTNEDKY